MILSAAVLTAVLAAAPLAADTAYARVTYVSGASVYVDAGERDGLVTDSEADVVRAGTRIAQLRVRFVSPSRAQCDIVSATAPPVEGDSVRFIRLTRVIPGDTAAVAPAPASLREPRRPDAALHGRVGVRYLATLQRDSGAGSVSQPATDIRVHGALPGLPGVEIALDARARRTRVVAIDGVLSRSRTSTLVYQSSVGWRRPSGPRVTVGRQYASEIAPVSLFDGVLAGYERPRFGAGLFAGTQPDANMGYSTTTREYGAYLAARSRPEGDVSWSLGSGAVASRVAGQLDREFGFVAMNVSARRVAAHALQEVDYNRGWKRAFDATLTPTSSYLSVRVRAADAVTLHAGYDSRRSVRLYRNYVTPDIAFDETFRTGAWGGVTARLGTVGDASLDARHASGGAAGTADIYSLLVATRQRLVVPFDLRARTSRYDTPAASGWLHSLALGGSPLAALRLEMIGGARLETPAPGTASAATIDRLTVAWIELNADIAVGRAWHVLLSATRERGGWDSADQFHTSLTWRF